LLGFFEYSLQFSEQFYDTLLLFWGEAKKWELVTEFIETWTDDINHFESFLPFVEMNKAQPGWVMGLCVADQTGGASSCYIAFTALLCRINCTAEMAWESDKSPLFTMTLTLPCDLLLHRGIAG